MIIVLIGPPGSGKGTQSAKLADYFQIPHLSTGEILRQAKRDQTELGLRIQEILDAGHLVDDATILDIVAERISQSDCKNGFLLDGYPRRLQQAIDLDQLLQSRNLSMTAAIELAVPKDQLKTRIQERLAKAVDPRPEDQPVALAKRLQIYEQETQPVVEFYLAANCLIQIDGALPINSVFTEIVSALAERQL